MAPTCSGKTSGRKDFLGRPAGRQRVRADSNSGQTGRSENRSAGMGGLSTQASPQALGTGAEGPHSAVVLLPWDERLPGVA